MEIGSLVLSAIGIAISLWAICRATSAYNLANTVIGRKNEQEDNKRLQELINILNSAKEAAKRNEKSASVYRKSGRAITDDLEFMREAPDALRTKVPISWDIGKRDIYGIVANEIDTALEAISDPNSTRDGWKDALSTLQAIIPQLEQEERDLRDRALIPVKA